MSPEQAAGDTERIGPAADQYSAGVTLYEALTGALPFPGTPATVISNIISQPPPPVSQYRADIDPRLEAICLKAMAKEPGQRYPDCRTFAATLQDWLAGKTVKTDAPPSPHSTIPMRPAPVPVPTRDQRALLVGLAVIAVAVLITLGIFVGIWLKGSPPAMARSSNPETTATKPPAPSTKPVTNSLPASPPSAATIPDRPRTPNAVEPPKVEPPATKPQVVAKPDLSPRPKDVPKVEPPPAPTPALKPTLTNRIGMELVLIPAGEFDMGSHEPAMDLAKVFNLKPEWIEDQYPLHHVRISRPFYLGQCEVTVGQFRTFVEVTGHQTEAETDAEGGWGFAGDKAEQKPKFNWRNPGFPQTEEQPVVNISWSDAKAYCDWLTRTEGRTYRLPTEAEWEYACRAGTGTRFSCGDLAEGLEGHANVADRELKKKLERLPKQKVAGERITDIDDGFAYTAPVGSLMPNKFGLHDMHGNVWEWCADWYDKGYYNKSPPVDPVNTKAGLLRVYRGGSWYVPGWSCQSAVRIAAAPSYRRFDLGFRVAADASAK
jgi:formylglycine-generating enzyme required for sulfatase activity